MLITRVSPFTGITHTLDIGVTAMQLKRWEQGELIQHAMPQLTADEREFIMTGVTAEEWWRSAWPRNGQLPLVVRNK